MCVCGIKVASNLILMVANICLLAMLTRRQLTQFATIKSPIDAVKFSKAIQLSPDCKLTM